MEEYKQSKMSGVQQDQNNTPTKNISKKECEPKPQLDTKQNQHKIQPDQKQNSVPTQIYVPKRKSN